MNSNTPGRRYSATNRRVAVPRPDLPSAPGATPTFNAPQRPRSASAAGSQRPAAVPGRAQRPAPAPRTASAPGRSTATRRVAQPVTRSTYNAQAGDDAAGPYSTARRRPSGTRIAPTSYTSRAAHGGYGSARGAGRGGGGTARRSRGLGAGYGASPLLTKVILGIAGCLLLGGVLGYCYFTMWRSVPVTVNGKEVGVRINSTVDDLLAANDYFGAKPGRLLSVGGNVLREDGGERCVVALGQGDDAKQLKASKFEKTVVNEGDVLTVSDGADTTEKYSENATPIAPGFQMEQGGAIQYVKQWGKEGKQGSWTGEQSGEVVDKGVIEQPQDFIVGSTNVQPKGKKKYMALTFDDGPSKYTPEILKILKEKGAKATFFNLGTSAAGNPEQVKAILDAGCELASHTNAHKNLPTLGVDALRAEITSAFDTLENASGFRPQMIRAPYGAFTGVEWRRAGDLISCNVLWNIDTLDWKLPGADVITQTILSQAFNGAIALMHDGGGNREQGVAALPGIIDGLHEAGYELVTVSELMSKDERFNKDLVEGKVKMPEGAVIPQV